MSIDITIGKLVFNEDEMKKDLKESIETIKSMDYFNYKHIDFSLEMYFDVKQCPNEDDGCTTEDTFCPGESYRSGSISGIYDFLRSTGLNDILCTIGSNNNQKIQKLKPIIDRINKANCCSTQQNAKRLLWLKFWSNKAIELYGDEAVIMFT